MAGLGGVVGGIPIRVDPSFLLLSVFMGLTGGRGVEGAAVWVIVVGISILVHELGHALTFRAFGVSSSVLLYAMGGLTVPEQGPRLRPGQDVLVSLAGPGVGLAFGGLVFLVAPPGDFAPESLARLTSLYLLYVNVAWGLVNLLPILPLDGGNVLAAVLQKTMGAKGVAAVRVVSLVAAAGLGAAALAYRQPFVAILAFYFGSINLAAMRGERGSPRPSPAEEVLVKGLAALDEGRLQGAEWAARNVLERPEASAEMKAAAAELLAWTGLAQDSSNMAAAGVAAAPPDAPAGALVQACMVLRRDGGDAAVPALAAGLCDGSRVIPARIVARVLLEAGVVVDLVEHLGTMPDRTRATAGFGRLQEVLHHAGAYREAAYAGGRAFGFTAAGIIAFNTACSLARLGQETDAVAWLHRAVDAGWQDEAQLERDADLETLRGRPEMAQVRSLLATAGAADAAGAPGTGGGAGRQDD
ncbi:MAG TPA: site-2 protease family protein [Acidimicrobiales bacterium]|nr:site-2 protease family protein [Acidimicrobiales bacterium]